MPDDYLPTGLSRMAANRQLWGLMCAMAAVVSFLFPFFLDQYDKTQRLMGPGASETLGRIVKVSPSYSDSSDTSYYEFTVNGRVFTGRINGTYAVGEAVSVRYFEEDPDQNALASENPNRYLWFFWLFLIHVLVFPVYAGAKTFRSYREASEQIVLLFVLGVGPAALLLTILFVLGYSTGIVSHLVHEHRLPILGLLLALVCSAGFLLVRRPQLPWGGRFRDASNRDIE